MPATARTSIEVGAIFAAVAFMLGISFNAGIQYANIHDLQVHQSMQDEQIKDLQQLQQGVPVRLTRIETILQQIQQQQQAAARLRQSAPNT